MFTSFSISLFIHSFIHFFTKSNYACSDSHTRSILHSFITIKGLQVEGGAGEPLTREDLPCLFLVVVVLDQITGQPIRSRGQAPHQQDQPLTGTDPVMKEPNTTGGKTDQPGESEFQKGTPNQGRIRPL